MKKLPDLKEYEHPTIAGFWAFCQERESIRKRKEAGMPYPWTDDIVLQMYFFCNVKREYDKGTQWYLNNVARSEFFGKLQPDLLWKTILYRSINSIKYFKDTFPEGQVFGSTVWAVYKDFLLEKIERGPLPSSSAYIILQGPDGRERKAHLLDQLEYLEKNIDFLTDHINNASSLKQVWKDLQDVPYVGPFIALQVYRDLILVDSIPFHDDDFTYLGPGARSGLVMFGFDHYKAQYLALQEIQKAHPEDLELNLGDVEQAMCEYRKYINLKAGGGRHRYYNNS